MLPGVSLGKIAAAGLPAFPPTRHRILFGKDLHSPPASPSMHGKVVALADTVVGVSDTVTTEGKWRTQYTCTRRTTVSSGLRQEA